jgi:multimeric flavodoxin WrbA
MKILVLSGSRNPEGKTALAINRLCRGADGAGATTEVVFLPNVKLDHCRQCDMDGNGLCTREGRCIIEDDFAGIVDKMNEADVLVLATPVYFGDLSESVRRFFERYRRVRFHPVIAGGPPPAGPGKPVMLLCYAGGMSGNGTVSCAAAVQGVVQLCGFDIVDVFLARRQNLEMKLPLLELTGAWLATGPSSGRPLTYAETQD